MEDGDTTSNISSHVEVPPYLRKQYTPLREVFQAHSSILPSKKSPESNSDAVIKSLKALQEKIRALEVERVAAADRFKLLSQQTSSVATMVATTAGSAPVSSVGTTTEQTRREGPSSPLTDMPDIGSSPLLRDTTPHAGLKSRLDLLDERLTQQAQELDAMQQKLRFADMSSVHHSHTPTQSQRECKCSATEEKLRALEQGVTRLSVAQSKTKEKMEQLESHIEHSPKGRVDPTSKQRSTVPFQSKRKVKPKTKKSKATSQRSGRSHSAPACSGGVALKCVPRPLPGVHYRLDMKDVPFILGSSTTPSHSVHTNYQRVLSLMKAHNHILCGAAALTKKNGQQKLVKRGISEEELEVLLTGLEEEYGALTFEHQALAQHFDKDPASQKPRVRASLELQLNHLEEQLESKAEQIRIVSKQLTSHTVKRNGPKSTSPVVTVMKECAEQTSKEAGEPTDTQTQRCFLKKMRALQSTLQRDDLNWK